MPEIIHSKLAGVDQKNDDGKSRQSVIKRFIIRGEEEVLLLEREPNNVYDPNAIAAYVYPDEDPWDEGMYQVGYIQKELAAQLAPRMDNGERITCGVVETTGGVEDKPSIGVNIALTIYTIEEVAKYEEDKKQKQVRNIEVTPPPTEPYPIYTATYARQYQPETSSAKPSTPSSPKSALTALIWCIFLGYFGAHQFYAGRKVLGWIYLFTCGLFLFGWLVDLVLIIIGRFKDDHGFPLRWVH